MPHKPQDVVVLERPHLVLAVSAVKTRAAISYFWFHHKTGIGEDLNPHSPIQYLSDIEPTSKGRRMVVVTVVVGNRYEISTFGTPT